MARQTQKHYWNIDFKSLAIGLLLTFCLTLGLAAAYRENENRPGRYECCGTGRTVFILDTQTGHTWGIDRAVTIDYGTPQERLSQAYYIDPKG